MVLSTERIEYDFLRSTLKKGILVSIGIYTVFFFYHLFISVKTFYPLLISFLAYIGILLFLYRLFQRRKYNLSRQLFLYFSVLFFAWTSFVMLGAETNNHYYFLIFSVLAIWMNHKESILSAILLFTIPLFLFIAAEFAFFPDIAIIDYPEELLRTEAIQNVIFTFLIIFYLSFLFNRAAIAKEVQLARKSEELQAINKTKDKLFSIISHDLKNPLSSMVGLSEILNDQASECESRRFHSMAEAVYESANRMQLLVLGLLDWSRAQTGGIKPNITRIKPREILDSIQQLYEPQLKEKQIGLTLVCDPELHINADYSMFETVVRNLFSNAVKFTHPGGSINMKVSESKGELILNIADTGVGMTREVLEKLTNSHEISSTFGTNNEPGTGLGLLVCFEFLKLLNFKMDIESTPGKGSSFSIHIPIS